MDTRKEIDILYDTITGELNRMCVTDDVAELDTMALHARGNIDKLQKLAYDKIMGKRGLNEDRRYKPLR